MSGMGEPEVVETQPESTPDQDILNDSLGNSFLKNVPDVDRKVLEPYVKDWDAGVTKRFQAIHDRYRPYTELGADVNALRKAMEIATVLENDPEFVHRQLTEYLRNNGMLQDQAPAIPQQPVQQEQEIDPKFAGLPEEFVTEFSQMRDLLVAVAQNLAQEKQSVKQQQEDQQLQDFMADLHKRHGDFDDDYVLTKMARGMNGEDAVKSYGAFVQNIINNVAGSVPKPPPILNGQGGVPSGGIDPAKLRGNGSKELMAQMLANSTKE